MGNLPDGCMQGALDRHLEGEYPECAGRVSCHAPVAQPGDLCAECVRSGDAISCAAWRIIEYVADIDIDRWPGSPPEKDKALAEVEAIIREEMGCQTS